MKTIFFVFLASTVGLFLGFEDRYGALDAFKLCLIPIILTVFVGRELLVGNRDNGPYLNDIVLR